MDVPKDIQQQLAVPDWETPMAITGGFDRQDLTGPVLTGLGLTGPG